MKIALLFLTMANIYHETYWKDFLHGHEDKYSLYVHAKETLPVDSFFKPFEVPFKVPTTWANTMNMQVALLREALKNPDNTKFIFVSESTLPLQHFDTMYATLLASEKSILWYEKNPYDNPQSNLYNRGRSLERIPQKFRYKNSQWVVLNRKHAELMAADGEYLPIITRYRNDQEHYPSSFLAAKGLLCDEVIVKDTTYVNWERSTDGCHPMIFSNFNDSYELSCITNAIKEGMLFARKIAASANIEKLDPYLSYRR